MPDTIRVGRGYRRQRRDRRGIYGFRAALGATAVLSLAVSAPHPAFAIEPPALALEELVLTAHRSIDQHAIAFLVLISGVVLFAVVTAIMLVRSRARATRTEAWSNDEIARLREELDRARALSLSEPQVVVVWPAGSDEPAIDGDPTIFGVLPTHSMLAFGLWLDASKAATIDRAVDALRNRGEAFSMTLSTLSGQPFEAHGRAIGGRAVLRLKDASGIKRELAELVSRYEKLSAEAGSLRALIEALPSPVWTRDTAGKLTFVNPAYVRAVEAKNSTDAVEHSVELLDTSARANIAEARDNGGYAGRLRAVVAGARRTFDVLDFQTPTGSTGIGIDATEVETMRNVLQRLADAHRRTLDQLSTGVAMFDAGQHLTFYNAAYRALWDLDAAFLDQGPGDSAVIDRLRAARKLPEESDFRQWKTQLHEAYRAVEDKEHIWHLPGGRTLRIITTPNPDGGVTYLFHDVTERLDLERRFQELIRVQGETLDNLNEGVAVFGSDGRLRLHNAAFARLWRLTPETLANRPHIEKITALTQPLHGDAPTWQALRNIVTAIENREPTLGRLERRDGSVVDCTTAPLPDGATLVTFHDVTDSVNVERALRERNEALEEADKIKVDFVHHVSYELRSPLTNIIGFVHLLGDPSTGPLAAKQREYLDYITVSTNSLLALINDILDLATIDAGRMQLSLGPVDIRETMVAAAEGVQDRLISAGLILDIKAREDIGSFIADKVRVRQILFNLLANAASFSPGGATIVVAAERRSDAIAFRVSDRGPGIPPDVLDKVFDWFETHSLGSQHRGPGIGLSLVRSFVELHGGTVSIASVVGQGTTVTCTFPLVETAALTAAE
ncbi:MAG TPA: PAS-domain containing protein [Xanthobacteraceae bacterium]|jgi:signal transduction histidine kinase|nr:PAS-domain containing protein [Xanthobacteraceae bacterium]